MKTRGALIRAVNTPWSVEEIEIGEPRAGEVLVALECTALCTSDHNLTTGAIPLPDGPVLGGHEGAGVVAAVGEGVTEFAVGDHVVTSFLPSCQECSSCQAGLPNLCELGRGLLDGRSISDGTHRVTAGGDPVFPMSLVGTFAPYVVAHQHSLVKIDPSIPFEIACLAGCTVITGYGAAVRSAKIAPGEDTAIVGAGDIGAAAIAGAVLCGAERIFVVDADPSRRENALKLGATHVYSSADDAYVEIAELTDRRMCRSVIVTSGHRDGAAVNSWMRLTAKAGTCVVTGMGDLSDADAALTLPISTLLQKNLQSAVFGGGHPRLDISELLALYKLGDLNLGDVITREYVLDDINDAYRDMHENRDFRAIIRFDR